MQDEYDNSAIEAETGTVQPSDEDSAADWDDIDPEEGTDVSPDEATSEEEADPEDGQPEPADNAEDEAAEGQALYAEETAKVKLADGQEVTVGELIQGQMRQGDYTRKTQEVAEQRRGVQAEAERLNQFTATLIDHLSSLIPDEPPASLAQSDPAAYTRQSALHNSAMQQLQQMMQLANEPKQIADEATQAQHREMLESENQRLVAMFPETGTQDGRKQFWAEASQAALDLGFSSDELGQIADHRLVALAHWARKGMQADKAKAAAKAKAEKAPPVAPRKPGGKLGGNRRDAMAALMSDDSIENAVRLLTS